MKERQRWQPEEDAVLQSYAAQYGPRDWGLLPQRMGLDSFHRDPKSCHERWKNYLRPGVKRGSLDPEEQALVVALQAKHGNKWKLIASHLPGRTPKRLGKWWEVFKEKRAKEEQAAAAKTCHHQLITPSSSSSSSPSSLLLQPQQGQYDHILETFAEKYVKSAAAPAPTANMIPGPDRLSTLPSEPAQPPAPAPPVLSLGGSSSGASSSTHHHFHRAMNLPPWMASSSASSSVTTNGTQPASLLSRSPLEARQQMAVLSELCRELEEGRQGWVQQKKEASWRLRRVEQQMEAEKERRRREKEEEVEARIRGLREEEKGCLERIEAECREHLRAIQRDAEAKEAKMVEAWTAKHARLTKVLDRIGGGGVGTSSSFVRAATQLPHGYGHNFSSVE